MTRTILVAPTAHGSGLTSTCLGLVGALQRQGVDVGFCKPLAQPSSQGAKSDRSTALIRLTSMLSPPDPIPVSQVERLLSENATESLLEQVIAAAEPVLAAHDVVIVEGLVAGPGLVYAGRMNVALAKAFDADVVLVGAENGDPIERLAETMAITAQTYRASEHDRVIGAVVNRLRETGPVAVQVLRTALAERDLALADRFRSGSS
jgi:phosphate acetyltransferase